MEKKHTSLAEDAVNMHFTYKREDALHVDSEKQKKSEIIIGQKIDKKNYS